MRQKQTAFRNHLNFKELRKADVVKAERQGFEPWRDLHPCRFSRPEADPRNDQVYKEIRDDASGEVPVLVPCPPGAVSGPVFSPELARVLGAWDHLPEAIRTAILALIQAANGHRL